MGLHCEVISLGSITGGEVSPMIRMLNNVGGKVKNKTKKNNENIIRKNIEIWFQLK